MAVRVGRRDQITTPRAARERLNMRRRDGLLVDGRDGLPILVPQLRDVTGHMAGPTARCGKAWIRPSTWERSGTPGTLRRPICRWVDLV